MPQTLEAKVRDSYNMGPVIAFSGHEYIRGEWRPVPSGFEPAALAHELLEVREAETQEEVHVTSQDQLAAWHAETEETVTAETPAEEPAPEKPKRRSRRKSKASEDA